MVPLPETTISISKVVNKTPISISKVRLFRKMRTFNLSLGWETILQAKMFRLESRLSERYKMEDIILILMKVMIYILETKIISTKEDKNLDKNGCLKFVQKDRNLFWMFVSKKI